jgi:hypothetical protein
MVLLQSAAPTGGALVFQQQQQQQQPTGWQFELPSSSTSSTSQQQQQQLQFELGSQMEDSLLEGMRQFEAGVDRAFGAFTNSVHVTDAAQASSEQVGSCEGGATECGHRVWRFHRQRALARHHASKEGEGIGGARHMTSNCAASAAVFLCLFQAQASSPPVNPIQ